MRFIGLILLLALTPFVSSYEFHPSNIVNISLSSTETPSLERVYAKDFSIEIFSSISLHHYKELIIKLTENGSREVGSESNAYARDWIADQLIELSNGRIDVEILGKYESVVGCLPGYISDSAPCFVVGGHFDTVPKAPGANDDGTGVATVLELARVMSAYEWPLDIYFCAWNAEEIGLFGSAEVAKIFAKRNLDIMLYYNIDMLLVEDSNAPPDERILMAYEAAEYWAYLTRTMSNNYGYNLIHPIPAGDFSGWYASDHQSFIRAGYNKVLFAFESGFNHDNTYHQPTDTYDNELYNYTVAIETVKAIGASMAFTMGREYGQPRRLQFKCILSPNTNRQYYFPITTKTQLTISGNWSGGGITFSIDSPFGVQVASESFRNVSLSCKTILNITTAEFGIYTLNLEPLMTPTSDDDDDITAYKLSYNPPQFITSFFEVSYDTDVNNDGILDSKQFWFDVGLFETDEDHDGLSDGLEILIGTSSNASDTDSDGLPDKWEYENGTNPTIPDALDDNDFDNLTNIQEYTSGTNPNNNDTDNDSMPDDFEVLYGLDPLTNDTAADLDVDNLSNLFEYMFGTNPSNNDTDGDQMSDSWEILHGLNPLIDDATLDPDGDLIINIDEYNLGLDPHHPDLRIDQVLLLVIPIAVIGIILLLIILKRRSS
jgi:hypothetical protein